MKYLEVIRNSYSCNNYEYTSVKQGFNTASNYPPRLTFSQTTNFRFFQTESLQTTISCLIKNGRKFSKGIGNTVGKGEIARYEQFLLFPQCFQKTCTADTYLQTVLSQVSHSPNFLLWVNFMQNKELST